MAVLVKYTIPLAGEEVGIERPGNDETNSTYELRSDEAADVWRKMIHTALADPLPVVDRLTEN